MNEDTKEAVTKLCTLISTSKDIHEDSKEKLERLVKQAANLTNGHQDKIQGIAELLFAMVVQDTRNLILLPEKITTVVAEQMGQHTAKCPLTSVSGLPPWVRWIYPLRWQVTMLIGIVLFAPQTPVVCSVVSKWLDK